MEVGALLAQQFPEGGFAFGNHWHMNKQFAARDFSLQIGMEAPQSDVPLVQPATLALLLEALQDVARTQKRDFWHSIPYDRYRAQAAMPRDFIPNYSGFRRSFQSMKPTERLHLLSITRRPRISLGRLNWQSRQPSMV
ncbi:hypothetical protein HED50_14310 [Ochrobactrum oryzae]|nr:hypothetical protein [Brucella oryzae]